jgi:hypothetical protein
VDQTNLRETLSRIGPQARADLRNLLIRNQESRDALAERLLRLRTREADALAELIDRLTLDDEARRYVVRLLGELEASSRQGE